MADVLFINKNAFNHNYAEKFYSLFDELLRVLMSLFYMLDVSSKFSFLGLWEDVR